MSRIILLTGLPRSGKTFVKNLLSLNQDIHTTEKEFFFFRYFDDKSFNIRGNYEQNRKFLFENCKKDCFRDQHTSASVALAARRQLPDGLVGHRGQLGVR